jgi:hypothetical protein
VSSTLQEAIALQVAQDVFERARRLRPKSLHILDILDFLETIQKRGLDESIHLKALSAAIFLDRLFNPGVDSRRNLCLVLRHGYILMHTLAFAS